MLVSLGVLLILWVLFSRYAWRIYPWSMKIAVCFILLSASVLFPPLAPASTSLLIPSTQSLIIHVKTERRNCWHRCRHLCMGRPRIACSLCVRQCKTKSA